MTYSILIVEDDGFQSQILAEMLRRRMGFNSLIAKNGRDALALLSKNEQADTIRLVVLDMNMPVMGGMETLEILSQKYPRLPVIMLTASEAVNDVVKAMCLGAVDFLVKPCESERMVVTVRNALKLSVLSKEVVRLQGQREGTLRFSSLIGCDGGLRDVVYLGKKAAASDITVLINGETGVGKEVLARAIHGESRRSGRPFVAVNCGAIPHSLAESTLFGHEKGSFTGATERVIGKFREAGGGTIFLDEVGELPLDLQVKLLRVLQKKEVESVGGGRPVSVDVRVISATNRDLQQDVAVGRFRDDLFYRLNPFSLYLPPLRERKEDILALASHFAQRFCIREGGVPKSLSSSLEAYLKNHEWRGNVRELENLMDRAMVVSEGRVLGVNDVLYGAKKSFGNSMLHNALDLNEEGDLCGVGIRIVSDSGEMKPLREIEREAMEIALLYHKNNVTKAAKSLGMSKATFYRKRKTGVGSVVNIGKV